MFFYTLLGFSLEPLQRLAELNLEIQDALIAVERVYEIMDLETERANEGRKAEFSGLRNSIDFSQVSFQYGCRDRVLHDIDLRIPAGSKIAIVGESGSGKSTFLKLLMRFYDPSDGRILFDGIDARDVKIDSLRAKVGLVSQDPFIFNGTIQDNIAFGRPDASLEEIAVAARTAGLEEFVTALPERWDSLIGERGANLSGGQRQRLAIARVLLMQPEIVIFDEATSHLDTTTEKAIQENLSAVLKDTTVIMVAHRLSTIRDVDMICVLNEGRIVERGDHAELLAANRWYAKLWQSQIGGWKPVTMLPKIPGNKPGQTADAPENILVGEMSHA